MEKLKPDATGIYVAAHQAPAAIEEAIEAEVPLIVVVAEHIPIHQIMKVIFLSFSASHSPFPFHMRYMKKKKKKSSNTI